VVPVNEGVPDGDIEDRFFPLSDRPDEVVEDHGEGDNNQDVDRPNQLGIFPPLGMARRKPNDAAYQGNIPQDHRRKPELLTIQLGPQQFRYEVKSGSKQPGNHKSEKDDVHVDRTYSAKNEPTDVRHEIRCNQIARRDHPNGGGQGEPCRRGHAKGPRRPVVVCRKGHSGNNSFIQ